jgi:hypothetical protein
MHNGFGQMKWQLNTQVLLLAQNGDEYTAFQLAAEKTM